MTLFDRSDEKNEILKNERGISFEEIIYYLTHDGLLETIEHSNQERYPG